MRSLGRCGRRRRKNGCVEENERTISQAHDVAFIELQKWMKATTGSRQCVLLQNLQPCNFPDTGRGIKAMKDVKPGSCIISIPQRLLISVDTIFRCSIGESLMKYGKRFTPQQVLAVFLAIESVKGNSSEWSPYIDTLPVDYSTPLYFSTSDVNLMTSKAKQMAESLRTRFGAACQEMLSFVKEAFPSLNGVVSKDVLKWAWSTVDTRSVYLETRPHPFLTLKPEESNVALAPFLDMLNHSDMAEITAGLNPVTDCYEIETETRYSKYQQVFISYGPHDNIKLLVNYGFVLPRNINNCFTFSTDDIRACIPGIEHWDRKAAILQESELQKSLVCTTEGPSWSLMTALKILALSWDSLTCWKTLLQGGSVGEENEVAARQMAHTLIQDALWKAKRHEKLVRKHPSSQHTHLILQLAVEDVDILEISVKLLLLGNR